MDYPCEHVVSIDEEPRHHLVIANEYVRAFVVEIAPHDRTLCHHHPHDYLLYVAGSAEIVSAAQGEEPKRLSYSDGECELSAAGLTHIVENLGDKPFRNMVVELQPAAGHLRRGAAPEASADADAGGFEARVVPILDDDRAAIFDVAIEIGACVEVFGPAVIGTPYENRLNPEALGDIQVWPNRICDLAWVPPRLKAVLWCSSSEFTERAIVVQIGAVDDEAFCAAPKSRKPIKSLYTHADEPK